MPSGVHLKALEVYTVLFQNIGVENLSKDLFIYSSGLFPLLENAGLSVKPILLGIYESYFLPLKRYLRPCLTGFILAILPGLEEGSDIYQRTFNLLKNISNQTDDAYFFTCLWSAMLFSSATRFPAIQYILAHFDRKKTMEDQLYLIGNSIDTMVNSICSCLQDPNSLVQRSILDFILQCLPMHNNQVTQDDKIKLIKTAIHLVLRRDMSLNRRIYAWFLGLDSNSNPIQLPKSVLIEHSLEKSQNNNENNFNSNIYFEEFSSDLLITSIKAFLNRDHQTHNSSTLSFVEIPTLPKDRIKIITNLSEKQEIGQFIIEKILLDLLLYAFKECENLNLAENATKEKNDIKKAIITLIFQSLQSNFIWEFCATKFEEACAYYTSFNDGLIQISPSKLCDLFIFILDLTSVSHINILAIILNSFQLNFYSKDSYINIQNECLPIMLKQILITLNKYCKKLTNHDLTTSFTLCLKILDKVRIVIKLLKSYFLLGSLSLF